ncbi:hypothetical protein B9Z55_006859 [Caenorhabditis nigoni]|uniref:Uncharacterized protein n=1 Tax=Caenorhabditis nigoni TaxID=1611254 RepID=A0A2G5V7A1_9PELO|nr:hypothetical protein B9Z55_006859 [Caenorhabditis nigoni]
MCSLPSSKNGDSMPGILAVMWTVALRNVTDQFNIASTGKFMESANYLGANECQWFPKMEKPATQQAMEAKKLGPKVQEDLMEEQMVFANGGGSSQNTEKSFVLLNQYF